MMNTMKPARLMSWFAKFGLAIAAFWSALPAVASAQSPSGFELLGRGINYGNIFEAPEEGAWGLRFDDAYPKLVREAGFDSVRIPIRWSAHGQSRAPFTLDADFVQRIQHAVKLSLDQNLKVILNVHHYEELYADPAAEKERFLSIWRQLSDLFAHADERMFFEILNEPHGNLKAPEWNAMLVEALQIIRQKHPKRWVIVGPDHWNNLSALPNLQLPASDRHLIVTVHYYLPFPFTHQGASWVQPPQPEGVRWSGSPEEVAAMEKDFQGVIDWAKKNERPIYVGEFGAFEKADQQSRAKWTKQVRSICEKNGFSWAYWELASGFGVLDRDSKTWKTPLLEALVK